jgi:hypothetical protein
MTEPLRNSVFGWELVPCPIGFAPVETIDAIFFDKVKKFIVFPPPVVFWK